MRAMPLPARRATLLAPLALAACANPLSRPFPDKRIFTLEPQRGTTQPPRPRAPLLLMRETQATPGTEARGLVRRLPANRQEVDFWNEFAAPPARLVDAALRRWLAASGTFAAVLDPGSTARADLALETTLTVLRADLADPARPVAQAAIAALVLDLRRERSPPIAQATAERSVALARTGPDEIVAGLTQALAECFTEIEALVRRAAG